MHCICEKIRNPYIPHMMMMMMEESGREGMRVSEEEFVYAGVGE